MSLVIPYRQGVQQLQRSESALSCPRRLVRVWNCPRCRPRCEGGGRQTSYFRSCFSCSDSQTRTPRGDANSFRLSDCLQPWGQGTSWWVPPQQVLCWRCRRPPRGIPFCSFDDTHDPCALLARVTTREANGSSIVGLVSFAGGPSRADRSRGCAFPMAADNKKKTRGRDV